MSNSLSKQLKQEKYGKTWLDKIPLPRRHAKKHNEKYKRECRTEYLMLDYYELG